jgi:hypothetical protein
MVEQVETVQRRSATEVRMAQIGLVVAAIGAITVVFDLFGLGVLGLVLGAVGAAMTFPFGAGERWYWGVAGGAILGIIAKLVAGPHQTIGGWLAVLAALAILIGASLGFPGEEE